MSQKNYENLTVLELKKILREKGISEYKNKKVYTLRKKDLIEAVVNSITTKGLPAKNSKKTCEDQNKLFNPKTGNCILDTNQNRVRLGLEKKTIKSIKKISPKTSKKTSPKTAKKLTAKKVKKTLPKTAKKLTAKKVKKTLPKTTKKLTAKKVKKTPSKTAKKTPPKTVKKTSPEIAKKTPPKIAKKTPPKIAKKTTHEQFIGDYTILEKFGEGSYGVVYKVSDKDGNFFAAKKISFDDGNLGEIDITMRIDHPHIIRGIDVVEDDTDLYFIQELGISFMEYINKLSSAYKLRIIYDIGSTLQFLLNNGIVHCDIKSNNWLMINGRIVLTDLGIALYIDDERDNICEIAEYNPPEYLVNKPQVDVKIKGHVSEDDIERRNRIQSEIWSYGMLCLDILFGSSFPSNNFIDIIISNDVNKTLRKLLGDRFDKLDSDLIEIYDLVLGKLLQKSLDKRARSFSEFTNNEIFEKRGFQQAVPIGNYNNLNEDYLTIPASDVVFFKTVNKWLIEVLQNFKCHNRIAFLALHLLRYKWSKYVNIKNKSKIQLFACACLYLSFRVFGYDEKEPEILEMADGAYDYEELMDYSSTFFVKENGIINTLTLYDYLLSFGMLRKSIKIMKNDIYYERTPEEIANDIIREETPKEANNRSSKSYYDFSRL